MNGRFVLTIGTALLLTPALSAADFFADLVTSVDAEFAAAATDNTSSLCILDEARLLRTKATIREALDLMQQAYRAQLPLAETAELRSALMEQFRRDVAILRRRHMWSRGSGTVEEAADDEYPMPLVSEFDTEACLRFVDERRAELRAHQTAARERLAAKGEAELLQRFDAAERAWEQYAEQGSYLYFCPIPGDAGNHTARHAFFGVTLPLYAHHEHFLKMLAGVAQD